MLLEVPRPERHPWPSLGGDVCDWIESHLTFGPGDLRGEPYRLDEEWRRIIWRLYEVYPKDHINAGRRRFRRAAISKRKGTAKTEFGAAIAAVELAPDGPVRCDGWRREGRTWVPVGAPVRDAYIPMLAYTAEQSEELAYAALCVMIAEGPFASDYDIGLERIMRVRGDGKAVALAGAPDARDGARTTFELFDETHRLRLPRQVHAHRTMLANLPKRRLADAWALEVTTAPEPGQNSVAEQTMTYARLVDAGAKADARLYFFHRQASEGHDLSTKDGVRTAVVEASGPTVEWSDIDGIAEQWDDPTADRAYLARVWLNMLIRGADQAFDVERWKAHETDEPIPPGASVALGFDGGRTVDSAALIACDLETGRLQVVGIWLPDDFPDGQVDDDPVDIAIDDAMENWNVVRAYCDPPYWKEAIARWQGRYGDKVVLRWETWRNRAMSYAVRNFNSAILAGSVTHLKHKLLDDHIGAARKREVNERDDRGERLWTISKERPDSPFLIDGATASILAWEARNDAIASGAGEVIEWALV